MQKCVKEQAMQKNPTKVLLIEDNPGDARLISAMLCEKAGTEFEVAWVDTLNAGLLSITHVRPDIVLLDLMLPDSVGIGTLKTTLSHAPHTPVIVLTGMEDETIAISAVRYGAQDYIVKADLERALLVRALRYAMERKRSEEELQKAHDLLETRVRERTDAFVMQNEKLLQEIEERLRAEEALKKSEKQFADIINFLPLATFAIDREGRVIIWNRAMEELTGTDARDMIGKGDYEYAIPFYGERRPLLIDLLLSSDEGIEQTYTIITREKNAIIAEAMLPLQKGGYVHLWGKASHVYDDQGSVIGAIESIKDITERKQIEANLRHSEARYRQLTRRIVERNGRVEFSAAADEDGS